MFGMRRTSFIAVFAATVALAGSAPASAETEHADHVDLPTSAKVVKTPKRLSLRAATRLRVKIRRTHRFPAPPRLKVARRQLERLSAHRGAAEPAAYEEPTVVGERERLFGTESSYWSKRDPVLNAIQSFNAVHVPRNGGRYVAPSLYEVQHGGRLPGCSTAIYNGVYCPGVNSIGWSMSWTAEAFRASGDMKWATLLAHEYGHAAQRFLSISGGWMSYTLYSEGFADCMAGAFLYNAHYHRQTDSVGRGDYNEFRDAFASLASPSTQLNNHGTFQWRYALATYGWNAGFDGCTRWARSIDGV